MPKIWGCLKISRDLVGQVVYSKSGRDKGKPMVVIDVVNDGFCLLVDGDTRRIEKPKLKNLKHIQITHQRAEDVLEILNRGEIPTNHIIKKNLSNIQGIGEKNGKEGW